MGASFWKVLNDQFAGTDAHAVQQFLELPFKTVKNLSLILINTNVNASPSVLLIDFATGMEVRDNDLHRFYNFRVVNKKSDR